MTRWLRVKADMALGAYAMYRSVVYNPGSQLA